MLINIEEYTEAVAQARIQRLHASRVLNYGYVGAPTSHGRRRLPRAEIAKKTITNDQSAARESPTADYHTITRDSQVTIPNGEIDRSKSPVISVNRKRHVKWKSSLKSLKAVSSAQEIKNDGAVRGPSGQKDDTRYQKKIRGIDTNTIDEPISSIEDLTVMSETDCDESPKRQITPSPSTNTSARPKQTSNQAITQKTPMKRKGTNRKYHSPERKQMVQYLIETNRIEKAKGYEVWKQMRQDGVLSHRSFGSLNNHFRRYVLPKIHGYPMDPSNLKKFLKLLHDKKGC